MYVSKPHSHGIADACTIDSPLQVPRAQWASLSKTSSSRAVQPGGGTAGGLVTGAEAQKRGPGNVQAQVGHGHAAPGCCGLTITARELAVGPHCGLAWGMCDCAGSIRCIDVTSTASMEQQNTNMWHSYLSQRPASPA